MKATLVGGGHIFPISVSEIVNSVNEIVPEQEPLKGSHPNKLKGKEVDLPKNKAEWKAYADTCWKNREGNASRKGRRGRR